ncbi:hypothetical protein [Pendulispora albinea]|uniref:Uncharacterized protein n=1 Tax=Pendulispora albinea TaxID=2741071 RepID=A0ABZ2M1T0_9BACT
MERSVRALSNHHVIWDGNSFGLTPTLTAEAAKSLSEWGDALPALVAALSDPDRFVAAHVLLTQLSGVEHGTFPLWNGLAVELRADGTTVIHPEQRFELARRWERWMKASPHPKTLPPEQ